MKYVFVKRSNDLKSFKMFETFGANIEKIEDLEKTDEKIKELIGRNYRTIILTNEVASFSENIIRRYNKTQDIKIIIALPR